MKRKALITSGRRQPWAAFRPGMLLTALLVGVWGNHVLAAPPRNPLPDPLYSFDGQSVQVQDGTVASTDLLLPGELQPIIVISGADLGFPDSQDDLDALSGNNAGFQQDIPFALLFSVDENSVGAANPSPVLTGLGLPFNMKDQAAKGQAAGDQFMSLTLTDRFGVVPPNGTAGPVGSNNTLVKNNYDEGGTDWSANPPTSASSSSGDPQDDLDGTVKNSGGSPLAGADGTGGQPLYYTATAGSPSLQKLSGGMGLAPSGATIFFKSDPRDGTDPTIFAAFGDLGLQQGDDINAMIIFDDNGNGEFDGTDQVLFSLTPGSISLPLPVSTTTAPGADVYVVTPGSAPGRFVGAFEMGLGVTGDNIDALDFVPCDDAVDCAQDFAIQQGAVPTLSEWGVLMMGLVLVVIASMLYRKSGAATI